MVKAHSLKWNKHVSPTFCAGVYTGHDSGNLSLEMSDDRTMKTTWDLLEVRHMIVPCQSTSKTNVKIVDPETSLTNNVVQTQRSVAMPPLIAHPSLLLTYERFDSKQLQSGRDL